MLRTKSVLSIDQSDQTLEIAGTICDDSDVVCFVHRPEYYHIYQDDKGNDMHNVALIIVAKNRLGYTGDALLYTNMPTRTFSHDNPYMKDDFKGGFSNRYTSFLMHKMRNRVWGSLSNFVFKA